MSLRLPLALALAPVLALSAIWDVRTGRIPDWISWPALGALLLWRLLARGLWANGGLAEAAAGAAALAVATVPLALWGKMGWGDVKLLAAVGAGFAWPLALDALFAISLAGAVQAVLALARRRGESNSTGIPYGVAIAAGSALAGLTEVWLHG